MNYAHPDRDALKGRRITALATTVPRPVSLVFLPIAVLLTVLLGLPQAAFAWTDYTIDAALGATAANPPIDSHVETGSMGRLRASLEGELDQVPSLRWQAAYEVVGFAYEQPSSSLNAGGSSGALPTLRVADLEHELSRGSHHFIGQNLDRLAVAHSLGAGTLTVGRQGVGHGSGRFFNPSDIFAPVAPQGVYSEYKSGIDGVRYTRPVGEDSEWELYAFLHDDTELSYALARGRTKVGALDISGYIGQTLEAPTVALDLAVDWLGAGWYLDGVTRFDRSPSRTTRVAVGAHYRLPMGINGFIEFHYNGPGHKRIEEAWKTLATPEGQNGELFLTARYYLALEADYELHPLITVAAVTVINLDDNSLLFQPSLSWSATDELSVNLGGSLGFGEGPNRFGLARSEFSSYSDLIFIEARTAF